MRKKRKTVWAFLDGKKLVDVVQAALDNNMMVDDLKAKLIAENPGHEVTFTCPATTIFASAHTCGASIINLRTVNGRNRLQSQGVL